MQSALLKSFISQDLVGGGVEKGRKLKKFEIVSIEQNITVTVAFSLSSAKNKFYTSQIIKLMIFMISAWQQSSVFDKQKVWS